MNVCFVPSLSLLLYQYVSCSVHCYHCYCYCCLLCCCCSVVLNLSLSQPRGFVFHSLCGGGVVATWSQTPAGPKPPQLLALNVGLERAEIRTKGEGVLGVIFFLFLFVLLDKKCLQCWPICLRGEAGLILISTVCSQCWCLF